MEIEQLEVANYGAFGEKVKAWAKGVDPLPTSVTELCDQLAKANAGATIPKRYKHVTFVQSDHETLVIKLPCKATLEAKEVQFQEQRGTYPLPAFYERVFEAPPKVADMESFQAERIGDYTIAHCG